MEPPVFPSKPASLDFAVWIWAPPPSQALKGWNLGGPQCPSRAYAHPCQLLKGTLQFPRGVNRSPSDSIPVLAPLQIRLEVLDH